MDLNVVGGHLALDLVNTIEPRVPGKTDGNEHLGSAADLLVWAQRLAVVSADEAKEIRQAWTSADQGSHSLAMTLELREATYAVMLAELGTATDAEPALTVLSRLWAEAVARSSLSLVPAEGTTDRLRVGTDPELRIPDRLAHAAVELLRSLDVGQLKTCPLDDGGCGWLFLDRSRNGSRRWCSMTDCGARAKARRLTDRRRTARASA